jgi:hypothetical protein
MAIIYLLCSSLLLLPVQDWLLLRAPFGAPVK